MHHIKRFGLIALGLAIGIGVLAFMVNNKAQPSIKPNELHGAPVLVTELTPQTYTSSISGFGTLAASQRYSVSAEVSGKVIWLHPQLSAGNKLPANTVVVRLDTQDLQLSLAKASADIDRIKTSIAQTKLEKTNAELSLKFAAENQVLIQKEYQRKEKLAKQGNLATSVLEAEQQKLINNQLDIASKEIQLQVFDARLESNQQELTKAQLSQDEIRRSLSKTTISLNQDASINTVNIEEGSFISMGSPLFTVQHPRKFELVAHYTHSGLARLGDWQHSTAHINAFVTINNQRYPATVDRIEDQLSSNRMVGIVVTLESDALISGSYVEVTLTTTINDALVVPRHVLHNQQLYWLSPEQTLHIAPAQIAFTQADDVVLHSKPAEHQLITSPLFPAINGMALTATEGTL